MLRKYVAHLFPDAAEGGSAVADPPAGERGNVPAESLNPRQNDSFADAFSELEKIGREEEHHSDKREEAPARAKEPPKESKEQTNEERQRGPDGKFLPVEKKVDKPAEKGKEDNKQPDKSPERKEPEVAPEKMAPKQLREAYERLSKKYQEIEREHTKLKAPAAQPADDPEKKSLLERLEAREKEYAALQDEMRFTAYERSQEYKDKYETPFIKAWHMGQERAAKLNTVEEKDDVGTVTQASRKGTSDDFDTLMRIQDDDEAANYANKVFGPKASMLLFHRERVQEANLARKTALDEFKKTGSEREKQFKEQISNQQKAVRTLFESSKTSGIEKYPQFFKPDEADPKTSELLNKGMRLADRAFGAPDEPGEKPLTPEQRIQLQAAMRNSFGAFQRVAYDLKKQSALVKELRAKLDEYEDSDPNKGGEVGKGGGGSGGKKTAEAAETPQAAFDAYFQ